MIYLYLFGTCFHFIYVFMIIGIYFCGVYADMTKQFTCGIDVTPCGQDEGYKNVTALS